MACGGCRKRAAARRAATSAATKAAMEKNLFSGYSNLNNTQLTARLEKYKKVYCKDKDCRYKCDYSMFMACKKKDSQ
jgi:hypothetical protein